MATPEPPILVTDALSAPFWEGARAHALVIQRCTACGLYIHLPRPVCRRCRSFDLAFEPVSGRGTVYSFTETRKAFHPFFVDRVPYLLATIALDEQPGLHMLSNLVRVAESDVTCDMPVRVEFERLSPDLVIPVFAPALDGAR